MAAGMGEWGNIEVTMTRRNNTGRHNAQQQAHAAPRAKINMARVVRLARRKGIPPDRLIEFVIAAVKLTGKAD